MNKTDNIDDLQNRWEADRKAGLPTDGAARVPLAELRVLPALYQARFGATETDGTVDRIHAAGLKASLQASKGGDLDPVSVILVGGVPYLVDGHHRHDAYGKAERVDIPVTWFEGSPIDAMLEAGRENQKSRLQMTTAEKAERAWKLTIMERFSKAQIMAGSGVSDGTVGAMRRELKALQEAGNGVPETWREVKAGNREGNPEWEGEQVAEYVDRLNKIIGPSSTVKSLGKLTLIAEAFGEWSPRLAEALAMTMVEMYGLKDRAQALAEAMEEERREEEGAVEDVYRF